MLLTISLFFSLISSGWTCNICSWYVEKHEVLKRGESCRPESGIEKVTLTRSFHQPDFFLSSKLSPGRPTNYPPLSLSLSLPPFPLNFAIFYLALSLEQAAGNLSPITLVCVSRNWRDGIDSETKWLDILVTRQFPPKSRRVILQMEHQSFNVGCCWSSYARTLFLRL